MGGTPVALQTEIINIALDAVTAVALDLKGAKESYWIIQNNTVDVYLNVSSVGPFFTLPVTVDLPFTMKSSDGYLYVRARGGAANLQVLICREEGY
tara:strand:+ start:633 stop:920 length:288 start_codon:yes stop_codon:yes gene_type:complete